VDLDETAFAPDRARFLTNGVDERLESEPGAAQEEDWFEH
jgi:hypothetical protein